LGLLALVLRHQTLLNPPFMLWEVSLPNHNILV